MWRKEFNCRLVWGLLDAEIKTETHPHQPEVLKGRLLKPVFWAMHQSSRHRAMHTVQGAQGTLLLSKPAA